LFAGDGPHGQVLFPIHPMEIARYTDFLAAVGARDSGLDRLHIWAVPTSSTRTFLAWPDSEPHKAIFVKTSLASPLFGDRHLYRRIVAGSVGRSDLVRGSLQAMPNALRFLFEPVGYLPRRMPDSGVIIRRIPEEICRGDVVVAPLFALFGSSEGHPPLLLTLIERTGLEPRELIDSLLCRQFARVWVEMSFCHGLLLEAHGQDLLLALSTELTPQGRFYYRDFEGLGVDWELRSIRGLVTPARMPGASAWFETYGTWGYRYYQLVWQKLMVSLFDYLYHVLDELNKSLVAWQRRGALGGPSFGQNEITALFSEHLSDAIRQVLDMPFAANVNILTSLRRCMIELMKLRKQLIVRCRTR